MKQCAKCGKRLSLLDALLGMRITVTDVPYVIRICWDCKRKHFSNLFD